VDGDRQPELFGSFPKRDDPGQDADRRNRDVPSAYTKTCSGIENSQSGVDCFPVHEWLTHSHEHDVRHLLGWIEQLHLADLSGDLEHLEIAGESHRTGRAEGALEGTARLR